MSERGIQANDLVQVIRPIQCCGNPSAIGRTFVVARIRHGENYCIHCNAKLGIQFSAIDQNGLGYHPSRLKRIPPLTAPEQVTTGDEVTV